MRSLRAHHGVTSYLANQGKALLRDTSIKIFKKFTNSGSSKMLIPVTEEQMRTDSRLRTEYMKWLSRKQGISLKGTGRQKTWEGNLN